MVMDPKDEEIDGHHCPLSPIDSVLKGISNEQFIQLCAFHVMVLVHRTEKIPKTCHMCKFGP